MRRRFAAFVLVLAVGPLLLLWLVACNRDRGAGYPRGKSCEKESDCPATMTCQKRSPDDDEGRCTPRMLEEGGAGPGTTGEGGAPHPAPTITAQPGDIQI